MEGREVVNDCYILQDGLGADACCDLVEASAMFAATRFLLRFFQPGIPPEAVEAFRARVVDTYNVRHRAVVDAIEIDRSGNRLFVSSEFGGQKPLRTVLEEGSDFPLELVVGFVLEVAQGLDAFHSHGLVYGTLDADSVWAAKDAGEVIELRFLKPGYLDFVPWYDREDAGTLERFAYLAPEVKGVAPFEVGPWSDVYSLGVHLYRFITGVLPFRAQSVERALNKSVSVLHVARALARRGVPQSLVRVAVRCVRRNPKLRYRSCVDLVSDLKLVLAERSRESEAAGLPDPARSIAYLNRERERLGAAQYARTLETAEYFRSITGGGSTPAGLEGRPRYPLDVRLARSDPDGVNELEELESVGEEDDEGIDADRLASESIRAVAAERTAGSFDGARTFAMAPSEAATRSETTEPEADAAFASRPAIPRAASSEFAGEPGPAVAGGGDAGTAEGRRARAVRGRSPVSPEPEDGVDGRKAEAGFGGGGLAAVRWKAEQVRLEAAASRMLEAFEAAKAKRGSFSFIERPADSRTLAILRRALLVMEEHGHLADAGSCAAGTEAVCARIAAALRAAVASRPRRERRKLVARCDAFEAALPLPPAAKFLEDEAAALRGIGAAAEALAAFGSRNRPLVLVIGDSERADRTLHALFLALATAALTSALYGIAFHGDTQAPDWHALSRTRGSADR